MLTYDLGQGDKDGAIIHISFANIFKWLDWFMMRTMSAIQISNKNTTIEIFMVDSMVSFFISMFIQRYLKITFDGKNYLTKYGQKFD